MFPSFDGSKFIKKGLGLMEYTVYIHNTFNSIIIHCEHEIDKVLDFISIFILS